MSISPPGSAAPPESPSPWDHAPYWWVIPAVVTVPLVPVSGMRFFVLAFTPGSCTDGGGCRACRLLSGAANTLSAGIAPAAWAWPPVRPGNIRRWWNPAAYAAAVVVSWYTLTRLPAVESDRGPER
ncbi:hypothetical protein OG948_01920 [Embleya sp. NBC_00888]|uniref:hypothetical protein n=1 Tax=Embleya sp. NBC_00888 TaxID=2975960 RepID=UPI003866740F|nr:hypothetical protein OG948_01920 [Embleya sp. NBC_00888]